MLKFALLLELASSPMRQEFFYIYHADKYCAKNVLDQTATIFSLSTLPRTCWGMFMVKVSTSKYRCFFDG